MAVSRAEPRLDPAAIAMQRFALSKRGFDTEEVQRFLAEVAEHVGRLEAELQQLAAHAELLEQRNAGAQEAAYAKVFRNLVGVMRGAEEAAARVRADAEAEAKAVVTAAREEAVRIVAKAREDAERVEAEAQARRQLLARAEAAAAAAKEAVAEQAPRPTQRNERTLPRHLEAVPPHEEDDMESLRQQLWAAAAQGWDEDASPPLPAEQPPNEAGGRLDGTDLWEPELEPDLRASLADLFGDDEDPPARTS